MSALGERARVLPAWRAVVLGFAVRLVFAATVGLVPATWAAESTRHFPRGELALLEQGGVLLFDVLVHGSLPYGATRVAGALSLILAVLALIPFGGLVFELYRPRGLARALTQSIARIGTSLLLAGVSLLLLSLVVIFETFAFGPVIASFEGTSAWPWIIGALFALPAPAAFALYGDALRLRGLLARDGFFDRFGVTLRLLRPHALGCFARYLSSAALQVCFVGGAVALGLAVVARSTSVFAVGMLGAFALLAAASFARAWLLAHLVSVVLPGPGDVEPLHGSSDVGYEAARSREEPR